MNLRDQIDITTELELGQARELREAAVRDRDSDEKVLEEAEARFGKAQGDRNKYLEEALKKVSEAKPVPKELAEKFKFGDYLMAAVAGKSLEGAMAELNQELEMQTDMTERGIWFPGNLFFADMVEADMELAADANTLVTNVTNAQPLNQGPITPLVYGMNIAQFIGVDTPMVAPGEQSYPYLSSGATVAFVGEGSQVDSVAAVFSKAQITPTRISGAFTVSKDSMLDVGPELESIVQNDLQMAVVDKVDEQIIIGNGTAPNIKGILTQLNTAAQWDGDTGATADDVAYGFLDYRKGSVAHLDGKIFRRPSDLRLVIGLETLRHGTGAVNSATQPTLDGWDAIRMKGPAMEYSQRIPAATAKTGTKGRFQVGILAAAERARNAILAQWLGATILVDPYTQGRKGIVEFSISRYIGMGYRRSGANGIEGFKKVEFTLEDKN